MTDEDERELENELARLQQEHRDRLIAGLLVTAVVGQGRWCGHGGIPSGWRQGSMFLFCSFGVKGVLPPWSVAGSDINSDL